jgi:hypothetical protein
LKFFIPISSLLAATKRCQDNLSASILQNS